MFKKINNIIKFFCGLVIVLVSLYVIMLLIGAIAIILSSKPLLGFTFVALAWAFIARLLYDTIDSL